ncbi:MAG: hypothetical protein D3917_15575, partial [Candidatus Electrothrix sp. AX5]|nr:hypothetical protein [Candidatus Electrothrix sp. AX5]
AYDILRGILIEEMMHMQLAANLCLALDTTPRFGIPDYSRDIPFLKPGVVINADMEPLNARTLAEMLAIETPEETLEGHSDSTPDGNVTPQYPYSSIGEKYDALIHGIKQVGVDQFGWDTTNQQKLWVDQGYPQVIRNIDDAKDAIEAIKEQGEGGNIGSDVRKPYKPSNFLVDLKYQMKNEAFGGAPDRPYKQIALKDHSHFGRLLKIQQDALHNNGLPEVYTGRDNPDYDANKKLRITFAMMIGDINMLWLGNPTMTPEQWWQAALKKMREVTVFAEECWKNGVIPDWS